MISLQSYLRYLCLAGAAGPISDAVTRAIGHTAGSAKATQSQHLSPSNPRSTHMTAAIWSRLQDQSQSQCMGAAQQPSVPQDCCQQGQYHHPAKLYLRTPPIQAPSDLWLPHHQAMHDSQESKGSVRHEASQHHGFQRRHIPGMLLQQISSVQDQHASGSHSSRTFHSSSRLLAWPEQQGISHGLVPSRSSSSSSSSSSSNSNGSKEAAVEAASPTPAPTAPQQALGAVRGPLAVRSVLAPQQVYQKVGVGPAHPVQHTQLPRSTKVCARENCTTLSCAGGKNW